MAPHHTHTIPRSRPRGNKWRRGDAHALKLPPGRDSEVLYNISERSRRGSDSACVRAGGACCPAREGCKLRYKLAPHSLRSLCTPPSRAALMRALLRACCNHASVCSLLAGVNLQLCLFLGSPPCTAPRPPHGPSRALYRATARPALATREGPLARACISLPSRCPLVSISLISHEATEAELPSRTDRLAVSGVGPSMPPKAE